MSEASANNETLDSLVPARMDRLPFSRWHVLVIAALGITWVLDGHEVTIIGIVASVLTDKVSGLSLTAEQIGLAGGIYIAGAALGALFFSYLTDRYGRKKLFIITPGYAERQGRKLLERQTEVVRAEGGNVAEAHLRMGQPAAEVVALAVELGADPLVVGGGGPRHMRRAVAATTQRASIGKAADAIVRTAPCPVIVVRGDAILEEDD